MSALDHFTSIDSFIATLKEEFAHEKSDLIAEYEKKLDELRTESKLVEQALKDQILRAQLETEVHKNVATEVRAYATETLATTHRLLAQFEMVARVFDDARALAAKIQGGPASSSTLAKIDQAVRASKPVEPLPPPPGQGSKISELTAEIENTLGRIHHSTAIPPNMISGHQE